MRVLLSFMPVSLMAGMALPDEVDTSLGILVKSARLTTRGEIGSRGSGKPTSFPGEINPHCLPSNGRDGVTLSLRLLWQCAAGRIAPDARHKSLARLRTVAA